MNQLQTVLDALQAARDISPTVQYTAYYENAIAIVKQMMQDEPIAWLSTDCFGERYLYFSKPVDNDPVQALFTVPQVVPADIPTEVTEVARNAIAAMLKEYEHPNIPSNAARAGWRACRLYLTSIKEAK
jgi:hypothetical protein